MFCPECRSEYRPGFDQCADCRVPLVEELPQPPKPSELGPEARRWELNRRDSLNIAFIKGALIGFACGEALRLLGGVFLVRSFVLVIGGSPSVPPLVRASSGSVGNAPTVGNCDGRLPRHPLVPVESDGLRG